MPATAGSSLVLLELAQLPARGDQGGLEARDLARGSSSRAIVARPRGRRGGHHEGPADGDAGGDADAAEGRLAAGGRARGGGAAILLLVELLGDSWPISSRACSASTPLGDDADAGPQAGLEGHQAHDALPRHAHAPLLDRDVGLNFEAVSRACGRPPRGCRTVSDQRISRTSRTMRPPSAVRRDSPAPVRAATELVIQLLGRVMAQTLQFLVPRGTSITLANSRPGATGDRQMGVAQAQHLPHLRGSSQPHIPATSSNLAQRDDQVRAPSRRARRRRRTGLARG